MARVGHWGIIQVTEDRHQIKKSQDASMAPRFHAAHPQTAQHANEAAPPAAKVLLAVAGKTHVGDDQLQQQAGELAQHLRDRQRRLATREATLNARSADYDDQQRSARLWLRERQTELDNRQAEYQRQLRELESLAAGYQTTAQAAQRVAQKQDQLEDTERALVDQRKQLEAELENVQHQVEWLEAARSAWQRQCQEEQHTLDQLREQLLDQLQANEQLNARLRSQLVQAQEDAQPSTQLDQRQREIEIEAARLAQQQAACEAERLALLRDHELAAARTAQQRQSIALHWRGRKREMERQRESLRSRQQAVDDQADALRLTQEKLDRQRCELTEQQIVVQHARAVMNRQIDADDFSHLEQAVTTYVQSKLVKAEHRISARKYELQELAESLRQQQETLKVRHTRLHAQLALRQRQLDEQAAQLEQREKELWRA